MQRLVMLLVSASLLYGGEEDSTPVTRWVGPEGSRPGTYQEWIAHNPVNESCRYVVLDTVISNGDAPWVSIYTDSVYVDSLEYELDVLSNHLQDDGFSVLRRSVGRKVHPETLRSFIKRDYDTLHIEGALFVGNIPVAWFQVRDDHDTLGYAEWPCDLFYMDLDGEWRDDSIRAGYDSAGQDSIYDFHSGNVAPEIYVGRLMPSGLDSQLTRLRNYFRKDNAFRHDTLRLPPKALFFIDDAWVTWSDTWSQELAVAYPDIENYDDEWVTRADTYRLKLDSARAWVSVFAHGYPFHHSFRYQGGWAGDYWASEYTTQDPPANFYNHFTCSFCCYTETSLACGGVTSVFNDSHGLCAIGSTKSGSMLESGWFYQPLAEGNTIGQAYLDWYDSIAVDGFTHAELCWYYGMTLLGDPFLRPVLQADVCPTAVICPERYYEQCDTIVPRVQVWNAGKDTASFAVTCSMTLNRQTYYASLESVFGLAAGAKTTVDLDSVFLGSGCYTVKVRTTMSGDENPLNDTFVSSVTVGWGWKQVADVPAMPSGRAVKDGGCLAYDAGTDRIYASKGYKTKTPTGSDFYAYDVNTDTWMQKAGIPLGTENKAPCKGSVICSDGNGKLYLTKGNNTVGFWEYDAAQDTWIQKMDVPLGESGKRVKKGAGIAWADGAAYLLKGYRNEFYKYDPAAGWITLTPAPVGLHKKWDAGSWLVSDGDHTLYAFKGKYHEFYAYDTETGAWSDTLHAMPIPGRSGNKKAKDGSCGAWFSGSIYAFKGGNTAEFWRYFPLGDSWHEQDDIPLYGRSGRRKKVHQGGALAGYPTAGGLYAFKGNKTFDFWRYVPGPSDANDAVERYASGGGRVVASGGPTLDGEQPLMDGLEASKPRWNWQGTMVCYSKTDTLTEREQIYQCYYGLPIPEQRVVDMDEDCEEPVYSPNGEYIAFQLDDTVSDFYQLCVTTASGAGGGGAGMDGVSGEPVGSADLSSEATAVSPNEDKAPNHRLGILSSKSAVDSRSAISAGPGNSGSVASLGLVWQITYAAEDHCYPEWSPDGHWLCYERDDDSGYTQIWRVPALGGTEEQLTFGDSDHLLPSYLNANEIVFILSPNVGYDVVGKVNVSTHQTAVVSNFQTDHDRPSPAWDGSGVVAEALDDSCNTQIVKIPIWVGSETWLTSGTSDIMEPDYSQDNRSVFAVRWTGITSQIVCVDAQNGGYHAVTDSLAIRDNPDALYNPNVHVTMAAYEREAWDPENLLFGGGRRRHGAGIYMSKFRLPKDGPQGASLGVLALDRAEPNPATNRVKIRWQVPVETDISLRVYNTAGQLVKVLADGRTKPGAYTSVWNGTDVRGRRLANGIYFYTLDNGANRISRKIVLTD